MAKFNPLQVDIPALLMALGIEAERHGNEKWKARCPSGKHEDNHPSWDIRDDKGSPKHGTHNCFTCHFGGTATDLVMHVREYATTVAAREFIEERAMGKPIPAFDLRVHMAPLRRVSFVLPKEVHVLPLSAWLSAPQRYVEGRGITAEQVARWGIGYAVQGRLNGRIVFPTFDAHARVCGYSARTFVGAPKRYLTPAREEHPDPSAVCGERYWPEPANRDAIIVTEGVINMLAVERCTPVPVGCLNGSYLSLGHIARLATFKHVYVFTDQDLAGDRADQELTEALTRHVRITRVRLLTRCATCGHELAEHVKGKGCRCCPEGACKKWAKEDPASMRRDMLAGVLAEHGLPVR